MFGGKKKSKENAVASSTESAVAPDVTPNHDKDLSEGMKFNNQMHNPVINGPAQEPTDYKAILKKVGIIIVAVLVISGLGTVIYSAFFKKDPVPPPPPPPPSRLACL
jgi:hypothetical protein